VVIAHAEVANFPRRVERVEGAGYLVGPHQDVRAVQEQAVEVFHLQALQALIHALPNVGCAEIVPPDVRSNAALGLDENPLPHLRVRGQPMSKQFFAPACAVDIGMVEEINAALEGRVKRPEDAPGGFAIRIAVPVAGESHAALDNAREFLAGGTERLLFHSINSERD
jgi:hypothetical protein